MTRVYSSHLTAFLSSSGLPRSHPESYHSYMWNNFFKHIDIDPGNAHILDGNAEDLEAECQAYEQKIAEAGGIELFVGGRMTLNQIICIMIFGVCNMTGCSFSSSLLRYWS